MATTSAPLRQIKSPLQKRQLQVRVMFALHQQPGDPRPPRPTALMIHQITQADLHMHMHMHMQAHHCSV